jgi:putative solute:sodium symporter small subunit
MSDKQDKATAYWKENLSISSNFIKHLVCGFLWSRNHFQRALDSIKLGGFPLGFGLRNRVQFMYLSY